MTTIKATDARSFLSLVPSLLGYAPAESTVLVLFNGNRTIGCMRVDLPRQGDTLSEYASTLVGLVCKKEDATGLAVIAYTERPHDERALAVLNALLVRGNDCGLDMKDLLYVAGDGWGSLLEGTSPRPLAELEANPEAPAYAESIGAIARLPEVDEDYRDQVLHAVEVWTGFDSPEQAIALFEGVVHDDEPLDPLAVAALVDLIEMPSMRDVALAQWCFDFERGVDALIAQLAWHTGDEFPAELGEFLHGGGPRPSVERLTRAHAHLRRTAAVLGSSGAFTALVWISWALGRSSEAEMYAKQVPADAPGRSMCDLMLTIIGAGMLPEWAWE